MRNEVFNSKKSPLNDRKMDSFTAKPIRAEDGNYQLCVTFDKSALQASSFYVDYRLSVSKEWISTHVEKVLNVISIKNLLPGIYQVRVVAIGARQQIPTNVKQIEIIDESPNTNNFIPQGIVNIASNLADDIIAEVYFNVSNDISYDKDDYGYYDQNDMT